MHCLNCQVTLLPETQVCPLCLTPTVNQIRQSKSPQGYPSYVGQATITWSGMRWLTLILVAINLVCLMVNALTFNSVLGWWSYWIIIISTTIITLNLIIKECLNEPLRFLFAVFTVVGVLVFYIDSVNGMSGWPIIWGVPFIEMFMLLVGEILVVFQQTDYYTLFGYQIIWILINLCLIFAILVMRINPIWPNVASVLLFVFSFVTHFIFEYHLVKQSSQKMFHS